ncbi:HNH endonuclease [Carnobacterium maltaromaticum]|uniref:HNH endonuclease n=1 Tax=Carnobacterium maltaromaticum TaxID=2751 RepID=UPI00191BAEC6|nr:HNH endonuclease signature motif containing protein [Carnobacterium maltaromaticum]CAD5900210.1 putative site-specific deoxyribonuclease [Carnobacterium maltaromaticum]
MDNNVWIFNSKYEVLDVLNNITLADSFLSNKIGTGNGEAKLYVGNDSDELNTFFDGFSKKEYEQAFFLKKDFQKMLTDLTSEFKDPQQTYYGKKSINKVRTIEDVTADMPVKWDTINNKLTQFPDVLDFEFFKSPITPPRIYINSDSEYYRELRDIGIPNISYCTIFKLKAVNGNIIYYFRPFVDYSNSIIGYFFPTKEEVKVIEEIENSDSKNESTKEGLIKSRIGQGKYREALFADMPYCPFTRINDERLLVASHIKPWVKSDDREKIDPQNGLTLSPTYDALFDKGFITFNSDGTLVVSPFISPMNQKRLGIYSGKKIGIERYFDERRCNYLEYHRNEVYQKI